MLLLTSDTQVLNTILLYGINNWVNNFKIKFKINHVATSDFVIKAKMWVGRLDVALSSVVWERSYVVDLCPVSLAIVYNRVTSNRVSVYVQHPSWYLAHISSVLSFSFNRVFLPVDSLSWFQCHEGLKFIHKHILLCDCAGNTFPLHVSLPLIFLWLARSHFHFHCPLSL